MNYLLSKTVILVSFFLLINLYSFAQLNPLLPPGSNFDLSAWKIHTLDSNYKFIEVYSAQLAAGYTSEFFYTNPTDGSMVFKVPSNGQPTTTATYPRVELRQMTQGANWALADTTEHYLEAECKVITVASAKPQTIIGQIHGSDVISELLKLRWTGEQPHHSYIITMKAGTITVTVNGYSTSKTYTSTYFGTNDRYYLKAGNYLQYSSSNPSIYGLVQFYKLSLKPTITLNLTALIEARYNGSTMVPDTVTVELHNSSSPYDLVESQKGVLNTSGIGTFYFTTAVIGTPYYIVVKHRNSLEIWSASPQIFRSGK